MNYQHSHERSIADPAGFWAEQAQAVSWLRPPTAIRAIRKNVAGHRLSTGEMEDLVARHPAVAECAVIGVPDAIKGQVPLGLILLKDGSRIAEQQLQRELTTMLREQSGALACFQRIARIKRLPKTRSGKILRAVLRKLANGEGVAPPSTIGDPAILGEIIDTLAVYARAG